MRKSRKIEDMKINPIVIDPPIFNVLIMPRMKLCISPVRQDSMVLKIVSPGTNGIMPGIRKTVTGALQIYAAISL